MDGFWGWEQGLTLLAPLVAIGIALVTRRVVPALAAGVVVGAFVARRGAVAPLGAAELSCVLGGAGCELSGFPTAATSYVASAVLDVENLTVTTFTLFVAAMIAVMGATGATRALVGGVQRLATGPRGAMLASWLGGLVVFFDDYANCLVVGQTMGPVCDRNGVSREKLSYIVDSTAAPVASLTLVSTWVGYEVGLIDEALATVGRAGDGYALFVAGLPYRFYCLFAIALVGMIAWTGRDLGPMLEAEVEARRAPRHDGPIATPGARSLLVAALPVLALVGVTFTMMLWQGIAALDGPLGDAPVYALLDGADPFFSMFVGAGCGYALAAGIGVGSGALDRDGLVRTTADGMRGVAEALLVLYLAWSLGNAIGDTAAQVFLTSALGSWLDPIWLPTVTFVLASLTALATGTSFGTMSILVPLAVPLAANLSADPVVLAATTSAVLAGACLGDHASPISDTTVLSAAGAGVGLVAHVRTQLPYALLAGVASVVGGYLPVAAGLSVWLTLPIGVLVMGGALLAFGRRPEALLGAPVSAR